MAEPGARRQVELAITSVNGQLPGSVQKEILIGLAVTLVHVFLFRLFMG